jgi:hypothetical protein
MSTTAPSRPPTEQPSDTGDRVIFWIVGATVVLLMVVGLFTYSAKERDEEAQALAAELTQKFEAAGLPTPQDQDILVRTLGNDGGAVCDNPADALGRALLLDQLSNGASFVGRRPVIADRRAVQGQALIMETYCPGELEEFRQNFDDLKYDDVIKN